jgi:Glycosyl hydrolases family 15
VDALHQARGGGIQHLAEGWDFQRALLSHLEKVWSSPDEGIWEVRAGPRHFTHSKVMAWVAFDRAIKSAEAFDLEGPIDHAGNIPNAIDVEWIKRGGDIIGRDHPPAYRFNAGQKAIFWIQVIAGSAMVVIGYILMFPFYARDDDRIAWRAMIINQRRIWHRHRISSGYCESRKSIGSRFAISAWLLRYLPITAPALQIAAIS